jgi:hypothetical protein
MPIIPYVTAPRVLAQTAYRISNFNHSSHPYHRLVMPVMNFMLIPARQTGEQNPFQCICHGVA